MRALWSQECASFKGRFVSFNEVFCRPLPADRKIPIVVGGDTRAAARRAGRLGDGYFPARGAVPELLDEMRRAAEEAGRNPAEIEITVSAPTTPEEIEALARRGVTRAGGGGSRSTSCRGLRRARCGPTEARRIRAWSRRWQCRAACSRESACATTARCASARPCGARPGWPTSR